MQVSGSTGARTSYSPQARTPRNANGAVPTNAQALAQGPQLQAPKQSRVRLQWSDAASPELNVRMSLQVVALWRRRVVAPSTKRSVFGRACRIRLRSRRCPVSPKRPSACETTAPRSPGLPNRQQSRALRPHSIGAAPSSHASVGVSAAAIGVKRQCPRHHVAAQHPAGPCRHQPRCYLRKSTVVAAAVRAPVSAISGSPAALSWVRSPTSVRALDDCFPATAPGPRPRPARSLCEDRAHRRRLIQTLGFAQ